MSVDSIVVGKNVAGIKRVRVHTRVSTKAQADVQHGSLEQQRNLAMRFFEQESETTGFQFEINIIAEDISGGQKSLEKRTEVQLTERAMEGGTIDGVAVEKLDRLFRINDELIRFLKKADRLGIDVYEFESGKKINWRDRGHRLVAGVKAMLAEDYIDELTEKVTRKGREARVNNGKDTSTCPILGLDAHPTRTGMYVPNAPELETVTDIFQKFCELKSYTATAEYCAQRGYRTKIRITKEKIDKNGVRIPPRTVGGEPFTPSRLRAHFVNSKYRGFGLFKDTWNQFPKLLDADGFVRWDYHHRREHGDIVDPDLLTRVYATVVEIAKFTRAKSIKSGGHALLSGTLKGWDGKPFYHETAGDNQYYTSASLKIRIRKKKVEEAVLSRIKTYLANSGTLQKVMDAALRHKLVGLPFLAEEVTGHERKVKELSDMLVGFSDGLRRAALKSDDAVEGVCRELLMEKSKVEAELKQAKNDLSAAEQKLAAIKAKFENQTADGWLRKAIEKFEEKTDLQKKRIIQAIIPEMVLLPNNQLELRVNPDPGGAATPGCHIAGGGKLLGISGNWRGGRDSNPRPSA